MQNRSILLLVVAVLFAILITACGGSGEPSTPELYVQMVEFSFNPVNLSAPAGSIITLNLTNDGTVEHNWVLMEAGYTAEPPFSDEDEAHVLQEFSLAAGAEQTFTFEAPTEIGEYQVVCSLPGHLEAGMEGTLTISQ